jgi:NtrC-family two-component system response regulator AlgB
MVWCGKSIAMTTVSFDILLVDDEPNIRRTLSLQLEGRGHRVRTAATLEGAQREITEHRFDLLLLDLRLGTGSGLDLLSWLKRADPALKTVVITAYASIETAVEAMKRGAADYLSKPFGPLELDLAVEKIAALTRLERKVRALEVDLTLAEGDLQVELTSLSPAMQEVLRQARQAAASDVRILLRGESGTGKGVVARAIHHWSPRSEAPFVVVPAPALPAELLESELFGHARGAFTGATQASPGRIALAEGGTLLLDEIGDLPLALQPKLLRFIQDREYERVGDPSVRRADVRILAATNRDLERSVADGRFRDDLFYRLNVLTLEIPPLRERRQDILPLAERLLGFFGRQYQRPGAHLSAESRRVLREYSWPGNVRELRNAIERATMLAEQDEIGPALLLPKASLGSSADAGSGQQTAEPAPGIEPTAPSSELELGDLVPLSGIEQEHIRRVLARTPSLREAAAILGIDQATLWRRRKQHGL